MLRQKIWNFVVGNSRENAGINHHGFSAPVQRNSGKTANLIETFTFGHSLAADELDKLGFRAMDQWKSKLIESQNGCIKTLAMEWANKPGSSNVISTPSLTVLDTNQESSQMHGQSNILGEFKKFTSGHSLAVNGLDKISFQAMDQWKSKLLESQKGWIKTLAMEWANKSGSSNVISTPSLTVLDTNQESSQMHEQSDILEEMKNFTSGHSLAVDGLGKLGFRAMDLTKSKSLESQKGWIKTLPMEWTNKSGSRNVISTSSLTTLNTSQENQRKSNDKYEILTPKSTTQDPNQENKNKSVLSRLWGGLISLVFGKSLVHAGLEQLGLSGIHKETSKVATNRPGSEKAKSSCRYSQMGKPFDDVWLAFKPNMYEAIMPTLLITDRLRIYCPPIYAKNDDKNVTTFFGYKSSIVWNPIADLWEQKWKGTFHLCEYYKMYLAGIDKIYNFGVQTRCGEYLTNKIGINLKHKIDQMFDVTLEYTTYYEHPSVMLESNISLSPYSEPGQKRIYGDGSCVFGQKVGRVNLLAGMHLAKTYIDQNVDWKKISMEISLGMFSPDCALRVTFRPGNKIYTINTYSKIKDKFEILCSLKYSKTNILESLLGIKFKYDHYQSYGMKLDFVKYICGGIWITNECNLTDI